MLLLIRTYFLPRGECWTGESIIRAQHLLNKLVSTFDKTWKRSIACLLTLLRPGTQFLCVGLWEKSWVLVWWGFLGFGWGFVTLFKRLRALPGMLHPNHIQAEFIKFVLVLWVEISFLEVIIIRADFGGRSFNLLTWQKQRYSFTVSLQWLWRAVEEGWGSETWSEMLLLVVRLHSWHLILLVLFNSSCEGQECQWWNGIIGSIYGKGHVLTELTAF